MKKSLNSILQIFLFIISCCIFLYLLAMIVFFIVFFTDDGSAIKLTIVYIGILILSGYGMFYSLSKLLK